VISFYLAPGTYKASIRESNYIWNEDLVITAGAETRTTAVFGGLNVHSRDFDGNPLDSSVSVYTQSTDEYVYSGNTGSEGVISFCLAPGTYKVKVRKSADVWYYDIVVIAGKATNVGDYINHNPVINSITADPARINPGGSTTITVSASDLDGDPLSYSYSASIGTVVGSGTTALYTAPTTSDTYRIDVVVSDGNGGTAQGSIFVSDKYGNLVVNSRGVGGEPLDSYVYVYKQSTGASVDSERTGSDGTITFSLLEDIYKIKVRESSDIWVENILVLYGTTGIIIGDDINNTAPVINSYSPAQSALSINEGERITFTANASDPDGPIPQYRWYLDGVFQSPLQAWTFYTSYTDSGNRSVTLEVTDGQYSVNQKWNVIVNNVNQNPIITNFYAANTTLSPLNSTDIRVTAVDFDGDDLNYSWSSTGGKFSTTSANNATWIAPEMSGLYNITVIVSDGNGGNATESLIIAVGEVVKTEEFVVINGAKEYTIRLYFADENSNILDLFRLPDPTTHDFPGISVPLRPSNKWVIEKVTVYNGEEEVHDEAELKQVLKALSGWVLAKYTTEHPINGNTSSFDILNHFSKTDDASQGNLMDIAQTKDEALGLERWVTCPQSIIDFGAWEDAVATSVEQSFRAGGCPPGFEESEGTKLADYVDEILEGMDLNKTDGVLVKGAIVTLVKALILRSEGVKSLSFLDEYAATKSIELEDDFRAGVKAVITTYGTDNHEDIIKQAIHDGVQAALKDATAKTVDEIINIAVPKITSILRDKISAQAATAFSSIVSGIGWGYLVADLTMDPCENFRILTSHSASMHVAQDYGKIEEVLMHDLASNREIDLTKAYSFITLRKMELSAIGQSYEALSRMGDVSLLNSFLDLVGTRLGYTASKGDILNKADVYLYPAKNTEKLTEFLVNKAIGEQDYSVEGGFISARMFRNEVKSFPITITPPINVEELEMYCLQWENAPKIEIKSHHSTGEQTKVDLNVFVPKDADIGIYRGIAVIKAKEKDFEVFFTITVLTDDLLRVEILAPKDREELNADTIEIKAEVTTKKGSEIEPVTGAEVRALLTSVSDASKELEMKHRENGIYTVTTTLKDRCPYTITVTAEKVCDTFFGFPTHCYEPGSDSVEFWVLIPE
jgi:hypothetical protein